MSNFDPRRRGARSSGAGRLLAAYGLVLGLGLSGTAEADLANPRKVFESPNADGGVASWDDTMLAATGPVPVAGFAFWSVIGEQGNFDNDANNVANDVRVTVLHTAGVPGHPNEGANNVSLVAMINDVTPGMNAGVQLPVRVDHGPNNDHFDRLVLSYGPVPQLNGSRLTATFDHLPAFTPPIPEPASRALFGMGAVLLILARRLASARRGQR